MSRKPNFDNDAAEDDGNVGSPPSRSSMNESKIALFIDFENIAIGVTDAKYKKFEVNLFLERLLEKGKIIVKRAYSDWDKFTVSKLKENDKYVIGVGVKNSSSDLLIDNCDEFIFYEDLVRGTQKAPNVTFKDKKQAEVFKLLIDSIKALMRENKEILWGSMIKQTMQRKKPTFNEEYYGYNTFSDLLEDAQKNDIIKIKKDVKSGSYVITGFAQPTT